MHRNRAILINRTATLAAVSMTFCSYFWQPSGAIQYVADILLRTYFQFVAAVMAHECAHGHLGGSRASNVWWGRLAIFPLIVPFAIFRKEHLQHHAATNIPGQDPDQFMETRRKWEIPIRAVILPFHWALWLRRHRRLTRRDVIQNITSMVLSISVYAGIAYFAGLARVLLGFVPVVFLQSFFLWYTFAVKTHAGYSTGPHETRSHDYRGKWFYWATFGLSLHRTHHLYPWLAWTQMAGHAQPLRWIDRRE